MKLSTLSQNKRKSSKERIGGKKTPRPLDIIPAADSIRVLQQPTRPQSPILLCGNGLDVNTIPEFANYLDNVEKIHPSLFPEKYIRDFEIDDCISISILEANKQSFVLNLGYRSYQAAHSVDYERLLCNLLQGDSKNKNIILLLVSANPDIKSNNAEHWLLAIIIQNTETIVLLDSCNYSNIYGQIFHNLLRVAAAACLVRNKPFESTKWTLIASEDAAKQHNGFDCGSFVAFNAYILLNGNGLENDNFDKSRLLRRWMLFTITTNTRELSYCHNPNYKTEKEDMLKEIAKFSEILEMIGVT